MSDEQLKALTTRLDAIIRLQCVMLPDSIMQQEKLELLSNSGLKSEEIGAIMGLKSSSVRGTLSKLRSKKGHEEGSDKPEPSISAGATSNEQSQNQTEAIGD